MSIFNLHANVLEGYRDFVRSYRRLRLWRGR
jgi:hypothetical protein